MIAAGALRFGTLGSSATFAGEAAAAMRERYPEFGECVYFPTIPECWDELDQGTVDVLLLSVERTGMRHHHGDVVLARGFFVLGQIALPLGCNLYVKDGARTSEIRTITGHGSILQCTAYLDRAFPGLPREPHGKNSIEAARMVVAGDGSMAVVGTASLPSLVAGLELAATGIDGGAICNWWAITKRPFFEEHPSNVVIAGRFMPNGRLGTLVDAIAATGFGLVTTALYTLDPASGLDDYLLCFTGSGTRAEVERALGAVDETRLVGAYTQRFP